MNKLVKWGGRVFTGALVCGSLMVGSFGTAAAAEEAPAIDGMEAFREAIVTPSKPDKRVFLQDLQFFMPALRGQLDLMGYTKGHNLKVSGNLEFVITGDDGNTVETAIPFFMDQKKKEMAIYFRPDKTWYKFQTPTLAAAATDDIATPDEKDIENILTTVKGVTVLRETDAQRTMLVKIDNEKLADLISAYSSQNPPDNGTADDAETQLAFMDCLEKGMRRADIWYTWTVDKKDWQTITMCYNLSSLVQETAKVALEEKRDWPAGIEALMENLAFYSDMRAYTTFLNADAKKRVELPEEAKSATPVEDLFGGDTPETLAAGK